MRLKTQRRARDPFYVHPMLRHCANRPSLNRPSVSGWRRPSRLQRPAPSPLGLRPQRALRHQASRNTAARERIAAVGPNAGTVTAYLVVPAGQGRFPAVIFGHWCMPGSDKKNRTEFLDEAVVLARSGVLSLLPDHVIVHPRFVADSTPLNDQQIAVEVQQDV